MDRITCHELPELFQGAADIFGEKRKSSARWMPEWGTGTWA